MSSKLSDLRGFVCLVTGASRGIGRGIAVGLGECGATVYITARTLRPKGESGNSAAPGSLEETASEITARGGVAIPVAVDHSDDTQVADLFARIRREQKGRLDILVNNVYAGADALTSSVKNNQKFWHMDGNETPASIWDAVNRVGLRNHYICSVLATRMMLEYHDELEDGDDKKAPKKEPRPGIIFNISSIGGLRYTFAAVYGIGKSAMDRMSSDLSTELKSCGKSVSVMSLWPGVVRTELMMKFADEAGDTLPIDINAHTESPEFTGRVLAEIAKESRADIMSRSGHVFVVADVASSKGIRDIDGRSPLSFRSYKFLLHYAGWKKVSACVPGCLKVPYFFLRPASPRF